MRRSLLISVAAFALASVLPLSSQAADSISSPAGPTPVNSHEDVRVSVDDEFAYLSCVRDYQGQRPISAVFAASRLWRAWDHDGTGAECFWTRGPEKRRVLGVELRPLSRLKSIVGDYRRDFHATRVRYRDDVTPYGKKPGERLAFRGTYRGVACRGLVVQASGVRLILVTRESKTVVDGFAFSLARTTMLIGHRA